MPAGSGLVNLYMRSRRSDKAVQPPDDKALWAAALKVLNLLAAAALDRFFLSLGAWLGTSLAHGANAVALPAGSAIA